MVGPYVVQTGFNLTWDRETRYVRACSVIDVEPGSALWTAYGGAGNLQPLPPNQHSDVADHSTLGD